MSKPDPDSAPGGLPASEINLAAAFASSSSTQRTTGLGGLGRRSRTTQRPATAEPAAAPSISGSTEDLAEPVRNPAPNPTGPAAVVEQPQKARPDVQSPAPRSAEPSSKSRPAPIEPAPGSARTAAKSDKTARSARTVKRSAAAGEGSPDARPAAKRQGVAYVAPATDQLLRHQHAQQKRSLGELVLMALNAQHQRLEELVRLQRPKVVEGPLFAMAEHTPRPRPTPITLRLSQAHWDVIDDLVQQYEAANRGELFDAAVQAEFGTQSS